MTKPPLTVIRETALISLPATVSAPATDSTVENINVGLFWGTEPPSTLSYPVFVAGIMSIQDLTKVLDLYESRSNILTTVTAESHVFHTGDKTTMVVEQDIAGVTVVTGTVGGNAHTFVNGTDYTVVDTNRDTALDSLQWTVSGTKPDNGTNVLITYNYNQIQITRTHYFRATFYVNCLASPLKVAESGASRKYEATEVIEAMHTGLVQWFEATFRPNMEAANVSVGLDLDADMAYNLKGSAIVQQQHTVKLDFQEDILTTQTRYVRTVRTVPSVLVA